MGDVTQLPARRSARVAVLDTHARSRSGPAARVLTAHRLVDQAVSECHDGLAGSGTKALVWAASTHMALTIGTDEAAAFFEMIARVVREINPIEPEPAA